MSEFAPLQKNECEELLLEEVKEGTLPVVCPTCVPNPNEPKRDWLLEKDPYKDARTCEYIVKLTAEKVTQVNFSKQTLRSYSEGLKKEGVSRLLRYFNRLESNETTSYLAENSVIPEDGIIVDDDSFIKIKVVVTAVVFDEIPAAPSSESDPLENDTALPSTMEINDTSFDFHTRFTAMMIALKAYDVRYSYFRQVDEGFLRYDVDGSFELFNINSFSKQLKEFKEQLDRFVKLNSFHFVSPVSFFMINDKIQTLEIEFDNTDPDHPLKINKVYVVSQQCPRVELKIGLDAFRRDAYMPSVLYFMSNFDDAYSDITAEETRDWLEFITDYVYPPIKVDYGDNPGEQIVPSGLNCALDINVADIAANALEDFIVNMMDIFEFEFNKNSCSDLLDNREPALKQFDNTKKQQRYEREYKQKLAILYKTDQSYKKLRAVPVQREGETPVEFGRRKRRREAEKSIYEEQLKHEASRAAKDTINELERANPNYFKHPYTKQMQMAVEAKVKSGDSLLAVWRDIQSLPPSDDLMQLFLNTVGLCGFSKALRKATSCLLKQVPYREVVKSAVKSVLSRLPIESVEEVFLGLSPQKQIEIKKQVKKEFPNSDLPWQKQTGMPKDVAKLVLEAYFEEILQLPTEDLLQTFGNYPALAVITETLRAQVACPSTVAKDLKNVELKAFKLDICNPSLPILPKIPRIKLINPWNIAAKSFKTAINTALSSVISSLIGKFINQLEGKICSALETSGSYFSANNFREALRQAFCPEASDKDIDELANSLLNKIGATDDTSSAMACLSGALLGIMSLNDMKRLMTNPEENPALLDRVIEAISVGCPRFADLFNNRPRVSNFFNNLGNFIPQEGRDRLAALDESDLNTPIYSSVCLTSEELARWNSLRESNLRNSGLSAEDASSQVQLYNDRASQALQDAMDGLNQNPNQGFLDALDDLLAPKPDLPAGCELEDGTSMYGTKALQEPKEVVKIQDEISNSMFDIIGNSFKQEFSNSPDPFTASLVSKILSDTRGNSFELHKFLENFLLTKAQYHDSEQQQQLKEQALGILADFGFGEDRGYYPETIGENCRTQILENREYITQETTTPEKIKEGTLKGLAYNKITPEKEAHDFKIPYRSGGIVRMGENVSYISDSLVNNPEPGFNYKTSLNSLTRGITVDVETHVDTKEIEGIVRDHVQENGLKYKNSIFNFYLTKQLSVLSSPPLFDKREVYRLFSELVMNESKALCIKESNGFLFGYEDEDLTPEELLYVGPNGEEPYDEYYSEDDKILGRAKVENDRVTFLNPEEYGGSYTVPPIYIAPKEMNGWLKISKIIAPDEEQCSPKSEGILSFSELKESINSSRNMTKIDPRVGAESEKCFVEKPFDKILSKNALAGIEGVVRMHLRMKISEEVTKALPVLSHVKFTQDNFDMSNASLIMESLIKDLKEVNPPFPRDIEKNNYYLLILEQVFQIYQRSTLDKLENLSSLPESLQVAVNTILSIKEAFSHKNIQTPSGKVTLNIPEVTFDPSLLSDENYFLYALAYHKYGESLFTATESIVFTPSDAFFMKKETKNLYAVIFAVRLVEEQCREILLHMLHEEYLKLMDRFYESYKPKIKSLPQYFLTSENAFLNNNIKLFGEQLYDEKILAGSFQSTGQPEDVVDVEISSPWGENSDNNVKFKIERYVRIDEKQDSDISGELRILLDSRDHNLKGVVSLEAAQNYISENIDLLGDYNITDLFGDASLPEDIEGKIGMKYGIRIIMKVPISSLDAPRGISMTDLQISKTEKAYYCQHSNLNRLIDTNISIPICSAEVDIKDQPLKDLNMISGPQSYNFDCLARKMCNSKEYKMFFNMITPIKAAASLVLNYSSLFFLKTIGIEDGWDEDTTPVSFKEETQFSKTNMVCRRFFVSLYTSNQANSKPSHNSPRLEFPDFFKLIFGGIELPNLNLNYIIPKDQKFEHKIIDYNPFDKNREECENEVDKLF